MKNVLNLQKISIKPILMGSIILFGTLSLIPNSLTYASLSDNSNLEESLDNIEDVENFDKVEVDPENPEASNNSTESTGGDNNSDKEYGTSNE